MTVLIPEVGGRKLNSAAERKLAERFRNEVGDDHVLMHSVGLVRHPTKRWAEADFVLIGPTGLFCLEVKGGRVSREGGVWKFTDRNGRTTSKHEGPFDQAGGAAGALQAWLTDNDIRRDDGSRFEVGYGVMSPDCILDYRGTDNEAALLCDERDKNDVLRSYVDRLADYWQRLRQCAGLTSNEVARLVEAIRPDFEATMTRSLAIGLVEDELIRFTNEQRAVLESVTDNERIVVRGAAGTGKSLLAINEARRLAEEGMRVLVVCHTGVIAAALDTAIKPERHVDVTTMGALMRRVVEDAGMLAEVPDADDDVLFGQHYPRIARQALNRTNPRVGYDALVVDEGQDLLRGDEIRVLDLLVEGGIREGRWRLFMDPNQNVFGDLSPAAMTLVESGAPVSFRLSHNCRNTQQIVETSSLLSGAEFAATSPTNGPEVLGLDQWQPDWMQRTHQLLEGFIDDGTNEDNIAVLTISRDQRDTLVDQRPHLYSTTSRRGRVLCSTVAGFKGCEATAVVLGGLWNLDEPHMRQAAYVGATRARVLLALALPEEARNSLERRVRDYAERAADRAAASATSWKGRDTNGRHSTEGPPGRDVQIP